jgi:hypothetical protein
MIKYLIKNKEIINEINFIFDLISLILNFSGTIIFNEIIIINSFGLNENTKAGKMQKEILDNEQIKASLILNENENEDNEI